MARNYKQGYYELKNPEKYIGDPDKIRYMSSWELEVHKFFDNNPKVLRWSSEEIAIPYFHPTKNRMARYYPDYYCEYLNKDGEVVREIVEVKPLHQTRRSRSRNPRTKLYEDLVYVENRAKWEAAMKWCEKHNLTFRILTERSVFK